MSEKADRRPLTEQEIESLIANGCSAGDWGHISVSPEFSPKGIINVSFMGKVSIGKRVMIRNVSDCIANYDIGDEVLIRNVGSLITLGRTGFGNGVRVAAVNENGGRAIPIFEGLSAQIAYLMAMYRHDAVLIEKFEGMAAMVAEQKTSEQGVIGDGVQITNCDAICNVNIGSSVLLHEVSRLQNGTILSSLCDRTKIGTDVIAQDFIISEGAQVNNAVRLKRCFVGQGVRLENGFSAVDSVFFANSHFEQGEACSVFAGPFSVSHHKATLLIAGMYSFYNGGSGTNNSNHMYKLGPLHQGVLERGCKSGSESYLMWPSRLGAFTTVIGKHGKRLDTAHFPFSVLLERGGRSELFVGLNLTNVGLVRDGEKWPKRDKRKMPRPDDQVNSGIFTPYTAQKMLAGIEWLRQLDEKQSGSGDVLHQGVAIRTPARGIELYQLALDRYFGDVLLTRLEMIIRAAGEKPPLAVLRDRLGREIDLGQSAWVDAAGLIAPKVALDELTDDIKAGRIDQIPMIAERFAEIHVNAAEYEWAWVAHQLERRFGRPVADWQGEDIAGMLRTSVEASEKLTAFQIEDAGKEFALSSRIGYGIDGDSGTQAADFIAVCGSAETNTTIRALKETLQQKKAQVEKVVQNFRPDN